MRRQIFCMLMVYFAAFFGSISLASAQAPATVIIMDGSGSMWGQIEGRPKLEIARETARTVLSSIPDELSLGLMAYGHRIRGDCTDIEMVVPPASGSSAAIADAVDKMRFQGKTPLSRSVELAAEALRSTEGPATVVLVTDGIETCEADPCAVAASLESSGVDFTAHVIGFGLSAEDGAQVSCIAENTGGRFIQVSDAGSLADALAATVAGEPMEVAAEPEPASTQRSRYFPGEELMLEVALQPTGQTTGEAAPFPTEPDFPKDATIEQCQAICKADDDCGSWTYEPVGSNFVDYARCFVYSPTTEFNISHRSQGEGWASGMKEGVVGLTRPYVPVGTEVEADLRVTEAVAPNAEFTVLWSGPAGDGDWVDIVPVGHTEHSGELSYFYVNDTIEDGDRPEGAGTLTAPAEAGTYELRYILGRDVDRRTVLTVPIEIGGDGPATASGDGTIATGALVPATFSADTGGLELYVTWSAVPVQGQELPPEAWAMQEGVIGPVTERFLAGQYEVRGDSGDSVFFDRVTILPGQANQFVIPVSRELSPAGEDAHTLSEAGYRCDESEPCAIKDETGLSFALPAGWIAEQPFYHETAAGSRADLPSATFTAQSGAAMLILNPVQWLDSNGTCTPSPVGDLCIWGEAGPESLAALAVLLPSLTHVK